MLNTCVKFALLNNMLFVDMLWHLAINNEPSAEQIIDVFFFLLNVKKLTDMY